MELIREQESEWGQSIAGRMAAESAYSAAAQKNRSGVEARLMMNLRD